MSLKKNKTSTRLGPDDNDKGGEEMVTYGTPEEVVKVKQYYTGNISNPAFPQKSY